MKRTKVLVAFLVLACAVTVAAQQPGGRGDANLTPEQQAQREKQRAAQQLADGVRPIEALDTVWIEEQTWMETRDHGKRLLDYRAKISADAISKAIAEWKPTQQSAVAMPSYFQ
jgi:hypothetical protein